MKKTSGYTLIRRHLRRYPRTLRHSLLRDLNKLITYHPVIGIMGKTGVGKSSLCNALFRSQVCAVNAVEACTRAPQRVRLRFGRHHLTLIDLPGVGESLSRDNDYQTLYQTLLPQLDMVLWVLKADDRAFSIEEQFYHTVLGSLSGKRPPILWVLNQVDKIEPAETWCWRSARPSPLQRHHLAQKQQAVAQALAIPETAIFPLSVRGHYQLPALVEAIITHLPKHAASPLVPHLQPEYQTAAVLTTARQGFGDSVVNVIEQVIDHAPLPGVAREALKGVTHIVARAARTLWAFFFG
ncbi:GTP-binding protein HSR1 [Edwardsiella hoshinae]|uniref:GTP-binding protein HSR1 n=1 Tax=Edwardsiella hoshinae TaxID=93378 RepID=A0ABN4T0D5_9GAMM|nr:GTPase [Edwardsiella hoshinae]AOV98668.1 GTP-binding protein HSR1 [Edwardsiella hoshinae]